MVRTQPTPIHCQSTSDKSCKFQEIYMELTPEKEEDLQKKVPGLGKTPNGWDGCCSAEQKHTMAEQASRTAPQGANLAETNLGGRQGAVQCKSLSVSSLDHRRAHTEDW